MAIIGAIAQGVMNYGLGMAGAAQQQEYNRETMALQYGYNSMIQQQGQQNNKEMWDYTNYENQKRHLENAGLNPALLYGMSGGGGATAAGAQGMGAGIASGHEMGIRQKVS